MTFLVFAAGLDWLEGLLPALFVGFWILSQVFAIFRRPANRGEQVPPVGRDTQPPLPPPRRQQPNPLDAGQPPDVELEGSESTTEILGDRARLEREIKEFLTSRRSDTSRAEARPEAASEQRPRQRGDTRRIRGAGKPARGAGSGAPPPFPPPPVAIDGPQPPVSGSDIARHVDEAFAHDLAHAVPAGRAENAVAPLPQPTSSHGLAALLRNPATIRQVMVMREVLERPVERWQ
jgi:hypothetical protein